VSEEESSREYFDREVSNFEEAASEDVAAFELQIRIEQLLILAALLLRELHRALSRPRSNESDSGTCLRKNRLPLKRDLDFSLACAPLVLDYSGAKPKPHSKTLCTLRVV
jgi:hypothetical protein